MTVSSASLDKLISAASSNLVQWTLHTDDIPLKKLSNAVRIHGVNQKDILALYDTTLFKSGKDGIVLCADSVFWKHPFEPSQKVAFSDLAKARIDAPKRILIIDGNTIEVKDEEFSRFLLALKSAILDESPYQSIYDAHIHSLLNEIDISVENNEIQYSEVLFESLEQAIDQSRTTFMDSLNYYGCLIQIKQENFDEAYAYFNQLKALSPQNSGKVEALKKDLDVKKTRSDFEILEKQKEACIQRNKFEEAIDLVYKEKALGIRPNNQLDEEIERITLLREKYVRTLESVVMECLEVKDFASALSYIDVLRKVNSFKNYDEFYVTAKIGTYDFSEIGEKISEIKESNPQLAENLEGKLQEAKENITNVIKEAVVNKNYSFFESRPFLQEAKDQWGMTPLMHFIVQGDLEGVKRFSQTFNPNDRNILGHSTYNLLMENEEEFIFNTLFILDDELKEMMRGLEKKENLHKVGNFFLKGIDSINTSSIEVAQTTSKLESGMDKSLYDYKKKIEDYALRLIKENVKEYYTFLVEPRNDQQESDKLVELKNQLDYDIQNLDEQKRQFNSNPFEVKNKELDLLLQDIAIGELGEKDEFETTPEYEARRDKKIQEVISNAQAYSGITAKLEALNGAFERELQQKKKELNAVDHEIEALQIQLNANIDISEILGYYYQSYASKIELGRYNADEEYFDLTVNQKEKKLNVPRKIARAFKMNFNQLKPKYKMDVEKKNKKIQHAFVYEIDGEQIEIPFLEGIYT